MPYQEDIYAEKPADDFDPETDLYEVIEDRQPGGESFSLDADEATVHYEIDRNKRRAFVRWALPFAYMKPKRSGTNVPKLYRENPVFHPTFPWLYAAGVSFQGFAPDGKKGLKAAGPNADPYWSETIGYEGRYQRCVATVKFKSNPWMVLDDIDPLVSTYGEIARNAFVDIAPSIESLSCEGPLGQLLWGETSPATALPVVVPEGPPVNEPVKAAFNTLVSKNIFTLNLVQYPQEFFSLEEHPDRPFVPTNISRCVGRVNNSDFLGLPAGTLLMQPPKIQRFRWPVMQKQGKQPLFGVNVQIPLYHHDPDKGKSDSEWRGYRLLSWAASLLWYRAYRQDKRTHLLPEEDFNIIFDPPV